MGKNLVNIFNKNPVSVKLKLEIEPEICVF